ncbi:MAG: helix-turn-helix domain-containing protein, partial [Bacteroidales bacterium]|nr:helix-turn-helix domain-containing protein [Bacteroidales bacterium]
NYKYILHFIPALAVFITAIVFRGRPVMRLDDFWNNDPFLSFRLIYGLSFFISITTYSIVAFVLINRHQRNIQNLVSYTSGKITLSWLLVISISFYVTYVAVFILGVYIIFAKDPSYDPTLPSYFGLTFFAFAFSFYGIKQPGIFNEILNSHTSPARFDKRGTATNPAVDNSPQMRVIQQEVSEAKYERSGLKEKDAQIYLQKLMEYMDKEKPYLDVDLTIHDISMALTIPRHYLTQVINGLMGKNFYTFINEYRIREVKNLLVDDEYSKYTLTSIAFDAGFSSKSSFNSIFKNSTGMTPSQFREAYLRDLPDSNDEK